MALLSVEHVTRRFGGVVAVDDVTLDVGEGEIVGLIGPNGAGKTTLFNLITRLYKPDAGEIAFDGESLLRTPPHRVVRLGIARTFQGTRLFPRLSVAENVRAAAQLRHKSTMADAVLGTQALDGSAVQLDGAGVGAQGAAQQVDERGLAGTVGADQSDARSRFEIEVDAARDRERAEGLAEAADGERGRAHRFDSRRRTRSSASGRLARPPSRNRTVSMSRMPTISIQWKGLICAA